MRAYPPSLPGGTHGGGSDVYYHRGGFAWLWPSFPRVYASPTHQSGNRNTAWKLWTMKMRATTSYLAMAR